MQLGDVAFALVDAGRPDRRRTPGSAVRSRPTGCTAGRWRSGSNRPRSPGRSPGEPGRRVTGADVGTGAGAAQLGTDVVLPLGPQHPSAHGVLQVRLTVDGDTSSARAGIGFLHRGAEKLFEVRDYRQITVLANRHDWLSAFGSEIGVVLAVERMLGLEVPAARGLAAHAAGRAEPGAAPPPPVVPRRGVRRPGAAAGGAGGGQRRADPLHGQPGRRAQGGRAGRLDRPGPPRRSTACARTCPAEPDVAAAAPAC